MNWKRDATGEGGRMQLFSVAGKPAVSRLQKPKRTNQELTTRTEKHAFHSYAMFADRL